jgi:RimJ/RimL family protein N-acetyltransferase
MGLQRVSSWCVAENVGSARVLKKLGMQLERRMRGHQYFKGRWWDTLCFAISREEWQAQIEDKI